MKRLLIAMAHATVVAHVVGAAVWIAASPRGFGPFGAGFWNGVGIPSLVALARRARWRATRGRSASGPGSPGSGSGSDWAS